MKQIAFNDKELRSILRCIRTRQDDCKKVMRTTIKSNPKHKLFYNLDCELEKLKMKIVGQS
jgi:hypothetical protein